MEDFRLRVFLTVAAELSFTRSAKALGITQPAVSQHIAELEKELGVTLFLRSRGAVSLTPEGRALIPWAQRIEDDWAAVGRLFQNPAMDQEEAVSEIAELIKELANSDAGKLFIDKIREILISLPYFPARRL